MIEQLLNYSDNKDALNHICDQSDREHRHVKRKPDNYRYAHQFTLTFKQYKNCHSPVRTNARKSFTLLPLHINTIHHAGSSNYISKPIMTQITHSPATQFVCLRNVGVNHQCAAVECGKRAPSKIRESGTLYSQDRLPGAIKCFCLKGGMAEKD